MVNDISGGKLDEKMIETVAKLNVPYIMMHMKGNPKTMQNLTNYDDIVHEMIHYYQKLILKQNSAKHNKEFYSFKKKFNKLFVVTAVVEKRNKIDFYHYTKADVYLDLDFKKLISEIEKGNPKQAISGKHKASSAPLSFAIIANNFVEDTCSSLSKTIAVSLI